MDIVGSTADLERWLAALTCACGARRFARDPVLAEAGGTVVVRVAGCSACHEPRALEVRLPDEVVASIAPVLARLPPAPSRLLDPGIVSALAPHVAKRFPAYAPPIDDRPVDTTGIALGDWRIERWLRGSLGFGQARCVRGDGARALATFTLAQREPLERVAEKLRLPSPGVAPILDLGTHGAYAVLLEAEPGGVPLATPMFPIAAELAAVIAGRLLEIVAETARRGGVLRGLRPELVYLDRDLAVRVAPRAEPFSGGMVRSRDLQPEDPFDAVYQAPEVIRGEAPTPAADVFSACAVLVFALTRRAPFAGPDPMSQIAAMLMGPPPLPATLGSRAAALVRAALAPEPARRPTALELAKALLAG